MDNKFPIYDITLDGSEEGLTAISFVDDPAIRRDFIYFSKEKPMIFLFDDEKREVVSPILIPNQLILRQDENGAFYYIRWTEEVIRECAYRYLSNGWFNNFTIMHPMFYNEELTYEDVLQNDVEMLRMWIVEEPDADDINVKYGFDLPKGTLCVHLKIGNEALWSRIKSGELRGLSIEAFTSIKLVQNKLKVKNMDVDKNTMSLFEKFLAFMNETKADAEALVKEAAKDKANSGDVTLQYWLDNEHYMQVDAEGYVRDEEANLIEEGKYLLADGNYLIVSGDNKFVGTEIASVEVVNEEIVEVPIAEKAVEVAQEEVVAEPQAEAVEEVVEQIEIAEKKDEKDDNEDKSDAPKNEGEDSDKSDGDADKTPSEDGKEDDEARGNEDEEDKKKKSKQSKVTIGEEEFDVPTKVAELINELIKGKADALKRLEELNDSTPSVQQVEAPINTDETSALSAYIGLLNRKRSR